jgi:uncharacterized protein YndB with AHSA1/START domain
LPEYGKLSYNTVNRTEEEKMASVTVEQFVKATPAQAYFAFTNATMLSLWMCDRATVSPHPGGRIYMHWYAGFYASGDFISFDPERQVSFNWLARGEPGTSQVTVDFELKDEGTLIKLTHLVPEGPQWKELADGFMEEWSTGLENLANMLETGQDLRLMNRPVTGIMPSDFNFDQMMKMRIPVNEGMRIDGVFAGTGAETAGLLRDDVIVNIAGKPVTSNTDTLEAALTGKRIGEKVDVVYYRGSDKRTTVLELSKRPLQRIPLEPPKLAMLIKEEYDPVIKELNDLFKNVSEELASRRPSRFDWSAKEILAHLIHNERSIHIQIEDMISGNENWADEASAISSARLQTTINIYGSINNMLIEYNRLCTSTIAFIAALPAEFVVRKGLYYRMGLQLFHNPVHLGIHLDQISETFRSVR